MSELSPDVIAQVRSSIEDERVRDLMLVVSRTFEAERRGRPIDGVLEVELAETRREQAFNFYRYPINDSGPTLNSSLEIVTDIVTIRKLATQGASAVLAAAQRQEYHDRVKEKGLLDEPELMGLWIPS
jgi:hypothetical protein